MGGENVHLKRVNTVTAKIIRAETSELEVQ